VTCVHGRPVAAVCAECTGNLALALVPALPAIFPGMRWAPPPAVVVPSSVAYPRQSTPTTWAWPPRAPAR